MECTHKKNETEEKSEHGRGLQEYPSSLDWRQKGVINPIRNQGSCGGCYSFSAVNALEAAYKIKKGTLLQLSEQQLLDCTNKQGNSGCGGGLMTNSYKYLLQNEIVSRDSYPYSAV
jgi:C1A family cysteine protease